MKVMQRSVTLLVLAVAVGWTAHAEARAPKQEEKDPDTMRVLWVTEEKIGQIPRFISQNLIGELDLTSKETVDLSHTPLEVSQASRLKFFLFLESRRADGCFDFPIACGGAPRPVEMPLERLKRSRLVAIGTVTKVVPGWATGIARPASLVFLEITEPLQDHDEIAIPGQTVVFMQLSGAEIQVSGRRLCSPDIGDPEPVVGREYLFFGYASEVDADEVRGRAFAIRDEMVYPNEQMEELKSAEPFSVWDLRDAFDTSSRPIER